MIVIRVELHKHGSGEVVELARAHICNVGGTQQLGDYAVRTLRGRGRLALDLHQVQRRGKVENYPRLKLHVWHLVVRALLAVGYK